MIYLRFGLPEHGWLPVNFESNGFKLQFDASDVPINPLDELCSALIIALQGGSAEMSWHLEPAWYYFKFEVVDVDKEITLIILESENSCSKSDEKFRLTGSYKAIILPFYRALKSIHAGENTDNWPIMDSAKIEKLTAVVKALNK